jgi:hypothetical protein
VGEVDWGAAHAVPFLRKIKIENEKTRENGRKQEKTRANDLNHEKTVVFHLTNLGDCGINNSAVTVPSHSRLGHKVQKSLFESDYWRFAYVHFYGKDGRRRS